MLKKTTKRLTATFFAAVIAAGLAGCGSTESTQAVVQEAQNTETIAQEASTSDTNAITVEDGQDVSITTEGTYVLSGTASDVSITVDVDSTQKVQLVLDGLSIQNEDAPAIYVLSADKVIVTTTEGSTNSLTVTGTFVEDGETNLDGVIFSKDDLELNGQGTLAITSSDNGVVSKDDLKVTGGTYAIEVAGDALQANDTVHVTDGDFDLVAGSDGIQSDVQVQIDGGTYQISAAEAIESTTVLINDGTLDITATDDGINATTKSEDGTTPSIQIAGGDITIQMGAGDTDALDSNGNLYITGGTVNITAQFAFDFDGEAQLTGGTVYVNGEQITSIQNSMMMGGGGPMGGGTHR